MRPTPRWCCDVDGDVAGFGPAIPFLDPDPQSPTLDPDVELVDEPGVALCAHARLSADRDFDVHRPRELNPIERA